MREYVLISKVQGPLTINLQVLDEKTRKMKSLVLQWRDKSRPLTEAEYQSREVQRLKLRGKVMVQTIEIEAPEKADTAAEAAPKALPAEEQKEPKQSGTGETSGRRGKTRNKG